MECSVYEMKKLSDLDSVVAKSSQIFYDKDDANNEILRFKGKKCLSEPHAGQTIQNVINDVKEIEKTFAIIIKANNQIQLILNDELVNMTAPLFTECQRLLLKYKLHGAKTDSYTNLSPQEIVATEQTRDVYNIVKKPYTPLNVTKAQKPDILLIDDKDTIYENDYFHFKELFINGVTKKQRKKTGKLFLRNIDSLYLVSSEVVKLDNGLYSVVITQTGKKLDSFDFFHNEYSAYRFRCMLLGNGVMYLSKKDEPRLFIKCKIR